jgi:hypothetical protein
MRGEYVMKKIISMFIFVLLISFTVSTDLTTDEKENIQVNQEEAISIDKVYDTWEEAREYEHIYYENNYYMFQCAYRIADTKRFRVTYVIDQ